MPGFVFPRNLVLEAYLGGWVDVTSELRDGSVNISYGQGSEQSGPASNYFTATMDNTSGNWTAENPLGAYYGKLGQNTPMRLSLRLAWDDFERSVGSGWGFSTSGDAWSSYVEYSVSGGKGHAVLPANSARAAIGPAGVVTKDSYLKVDYTPTVSDVTGDELSVGFYLRYLDTNNYYFARFVVNPADDLYRLQVWRRRDGVFTGVSTDQPTVGLTHTAGQTVSLAAAIEGRTVFMKMWDASLPEPYDWQQIEVDDDPGATIDDPGRWAVRCETAGGNTNVKPLTFDFDNFEARVILASGVLGEINEEWDASEANMTAPIRVNGTLNRLQSTNQPVKSALRRVYDTNPASDVRAYWPAEDGIGATAISSGMAGVLPMSIEGTAKFASYDGFECSAPLPYVGKSSWTGEVPYHPATGFAMTRALLSVPSSGAVDGDVIQRTYLTGTLWYFDVQYKTGGNLTMQAYDGANNLLHTTGLIAFAVDGADNRLQINFTQNGANVDYTVALLKPGDPNAGIWSDTVVNRTLGRIERVVVNPYRNLDNLAFGHLSVHDKVTSVFANALELNAFWGEDHLNRFIRLCNENRIPVSWFGYLNQGTPMGYQRVATLTALLDEIAAVDQGVYHDLRTVPGLHYRNRFALETQSAKLVLNYAVGQVAPSLKPASDILNPRNDVLGRRVNGGEYRYAKTSGPKNVNDPGDDPLGIGRYEGQLDLNLASDLQLPEIVQFDVALATHPARRFTAVTVDLAAEELADNVLQSAVLAMSVGDRLVIANVQTAHFYDIIDLMVLGYRMNIGAAGALHSVTFNTGNYGPWRIFTFGLEDHSRLDSSTTVLNASINTSATSVDILNADDTRWATTALHPAEFPYYVMVSGEEMRVTAASGTGAVQTLTVDRSINGVVKAHTAGTPISLRYTGYLGRK